MRLFYRVESFFSNITDSISDRIYNYHLKKEYDRLEEEEYKNYYVCNVSTIQSSEKVFLSEYDLAYIIWRGSKKQYKRFCLDHYIFDFDRISTEFYQLLKNGNFWLVHDLNDEVISDLCVDVEYNCYKFKDTSEYEKFVAEMNETIKEELPKIGKNSSRDVFDFFEEKLNEKYRKDGFKYFRA